MIKKEEKYDRQLRLWADNGQNELGNSNILVIKPNITSLELLKNLILPGIGKFTLLDNQKVISIKDLCNNFYLNDTDLGKNKLKTLVNNLVELNKEDVIGNFITIKNDLKNFILNTDINFWNQFNLIIIDWNYDFIIQNEFIKKLDIPIVAINSISYFGFIRIYNNSYNVIETHSQVNSDLRLLSPWNQLLKFSDSFDLLNLNILEHSQVPYLIIQLKALQYWFNIHKIIPKTSQEKMEFKNIIQSWKKQFNELNFDEAINNSHKIFNQIKIPLNIKNIFNKLNENFNFEELKLKNIPLSKKDLFWILIKALNIFINTHDGFLPLNDDLPDMDSTTFNYLTLKNIYKKKAKNDLNDFKNILNQLFLKINKPLNYYSEANLIKFIKNSKSLFYSENSRNMINFIQLIDCCPDLSNQNKSIILGILTIEKFILKNKFFPKLKNLDELNEISIEIYNNNNINNNNNEVFEKVLYELIRGEGYQLNNIASILGGIGGQECLKLITNQYIPLDNFLIFDGLKSVTERYKI